MENTEQRSEGPVPELLRLVDLVAKYPEIGPPLAELAFKIGQAEIGNRLVRMGVEGGTPGLEYYVVAANAARHDGRIDDALRATVDAVRAFAAAADAALQPDDGVRLLHLVRTAFSMSRGSWPMTSGARSSTQPTTARVFHSSVASPQP